MSSKLKKERLVYGYVREFIEDYSINYITNIILEYYIIPFCWNKGDISNDIILLKNDSRIAIFNQKSSKNMTIVCDTIFDSDIHYYTIKIIKFDSSFDIIMGFVPSKYKPKKDYVGDINAGFGYMFDGDIYNRDNKIYGKLYQSKGLSIGDIVKCEINFNNKTIKYYVNNKDIGIAFDNVNGSVKPGLTLYRNGNSVELLDVK